MSTSHLSPVRTTSNDKENHQDMSTMTLEEFIPHQLKIAHELIMQHAEARIDQIKRMNHASHEPNLALQDKTAEGLANVRSSSVDNDVTTAADVELDTKDAHHHRSSRDVGNKIAKYLLLIEIIKGPYETKCVELGLDSAFKTRRTCHLGRKKNKQYLPPYGLSLPLDEEVSSKHAELCLDDENQVTCMDIGSTNGSWLNEYVKVFLARMR